MGLNLKKKTAYGVYANYWKIGNMGIIDLCDGKVEINFDIRPYYKKGADKYFESDIQKFTVIGDKRFEGNFHSYLYSELLKTEFFADAESDEVVEE